MTPKRRSLQLLLLMMQLLQPTTAETSAQRHKHERRLEYREELLELLELLEKKEYEPHRPKAYYSDEEAARQWIQTTNEELKQWKHRSALLEWNFITNITDYNQRKVLDNSKRFTEWTRSTLAEARRFRYQHFLSRDLRRQFLLFTQSIDSSDPEQAEQVSGILATMESTYNKATVCMQEKGVAKQHYSSRDNNCLSLEPELLDLMAKSRDPEELKEAWIGWRDVAGKPQKQRYAHFVSLLNQAARGSGYSDYGEGWREALFPDNTDVIQMTSRLWEELRPLYLQLHAYVRRKLRETYGKEVMGKDGAIPAHLLGNMWAQEWQDIYPLVTPYPEIRHSAQNLDVTLKEKYDVIDLFSLAEKFYASMGLYNMTDIFWSRSMLVKPTDRDVQCHASAEDLYERDDFRIKMCTEVTSEYLQTVHHEMGHVQYFMAYQDQPTIYRDGANCAFHEAIGDTIALSVMSRTHLESLGLYQHGGNDETRETINDLMKMALRKIAFLPFGLVVDRWRWQVFGDVTTPQNYNRDWWKLRLDLQGLRSPEPRTESDFDPAAKFHVASNSPYICYFVSHVAQFQFYKALCDASGHQVALHLCDFGGSPQAGAIFKRFMAAGSSRPWQDILQELTGSREISAGPMLEYFRPLSDWLKADNLRHNEPLGWENASINWGHN